MHVADVSALRAVVEGLPDHGVLGLALRGHSSPTKMVLAPGLEVKVKNWKKSCKDTLGPALGPIFTMLGQEKLVKGAIVTMLGEKRLVTVELDGPPPPRREI